MPEPIDLTTPEWSVSAVKPGPAGTVEVVAAVAAAMAELPAIGKDSKAAKEQGGYAYRGIEAITGHLQALLAKHQVLTIPRAEILATVPSPGMNQGWTDVTMRVEWLVAGADGSSFTAVTNGIGRDKSDKGANKAQTQAHKYLLLPLFCIADRKDDADGDSYEAERAQPVTLAAGEMWAAEAKKRLLMGLEGDKAAAKVAWTSAGLDGRQKVTDAELELAERHGTEAAAAGQHLAANPAAEGEGVGSPPSGPAPTPATDEAPSGSAPSVIAEFEKRAADIADKAAARKAGTP